MPTTTPFNNLITFSRGSNATLTGPNGLIQWAPNNLLTFSEQFDNAAWTKVATTVTANNSVAPDGTTTADTLIGDGTSAAHQVRLSVPASGAFQHVLSVYLKQGTERYGYLYTLGRNVTDDKSDFCFFDLQTGTITQTNGSGVGATISAVGNGWYRVTMPTGSYPSSINIETRIGITNTLNQQTSTASGNFLVWGAQLELGSTATAYNPTSPKNILSFSEAFDSGNWIKVSSSIVTGAAANPINGLFNAQKLMEDTTNTQHFIYNGSLVASGPVTLSVYAKFAGRRWLRLSAASGPNVWFDLVNGVLGTVTSGATASITPVGNGWYRCSSTVIYNNTINYIFLADANNSFSYTGDGNSGVYIYGAQLSDSASLDPYVPTPGAAPSSTAFYGPRFDFDPVTLQPRGLLVEEQRTNICLRSEDFANAAWVKSSYTASSDAGIAPDGTLTADQITTTGGNGSVTQTITVVASTNYVFSFYARKGTAANARYSIYNFSGAADIIAPTNYPAEFQSGSWVRVIVPFTTPVGCTSINIYTHRDTASAGTTLVWGAQLEAGAFATSYIPTIASTVTRSADVATITGQNFAQWYRQAEGTVVAEFSTVMGTTPIGVVFGGGSQVFQTRIETGLARSGIRGVADLITSTGPSLTAPGSNKVASTYLSGSNGISANAGATVTSAVTFTSSGGALVALGSDGLSNNNYINGHIRNIRFIPARAADFQLQALTT